MEIGKLYKYYNRPGRHDRRCIYLGEDFIHRSDGVTIENHKVLFVGELKPTIIDVSCMKYLREIEQ